MILLYSDTGGKQLTVDSEQDLKKLQAIGRVVALTIRAMEQAVRPGVTTRELDEIGSAVMEQHGARSAPRLVYQFPGATCISINQEAAHGIPDNREVQPGDLVNIDVSAEKDGFFADAATTVMVPPTSTLQRKLCQCTQKALHKAMRAAKAGELLSVVGKAVEAEAQRCGFTILRDLTGHGVGRTIHEEPRAVLNYYNPFDQRRFLEGMVLTIEPFLANGATRSVTAADGWTLTTPDGSLSAQYEHTIVITHGRPIVLTALSS